MELNRRAILDEFSDVLGEITEVKTVTRSFTDEGIAGYHAADCPLIEVQEPEESEDRSLTSQRQIMFLDMKLRVWFVLWDEEPDTAYETLMKKVRNKIGDHFTINNTATGSWVTRVGQVQGSVPLYHFEMDVRIKYYLDQKDV